MSEEGEDTRTPTQTDNHVTSPTDTRDIIDKGYCKILGAILQANLSWAEQLEKGKRALLPTLRRNLGALQHLGKKIPLGCRKIMATGLIMSRLIYLMPLWGSSTDNYLRKAQIVWNKTARWTTGLRRRH